MNYDLHARNWVMRAEMRALRELIPDAERAEAGRAIAETVLSGRLTDPETLPSDRLRNRQSASSEGFLIPRITRGSVLAMYASDGGEPDFIPILPKLLVEGVVCCFPAFRDGEMRFCTASDATDLVPGDFGIREPGSDATYIAGEKIDVMLVPGMAFDLLGARLGRGKGFYDRYLSSVDPLFAPIRIGTAYDFQIVPEVPSAEADVRMDYIVTPTIFRSVI